jgi:hypothetical protein
VAHDVDRVRAQLDEWSDTARALDEAGATGALLAWAWSEIGRHDLALHWLEHARMRDRDGFIARTYPVLASTLEQIERSHHYARR